MKLFYRILGEGSPVVILHGLYGSSDNWMRVARALSNNYCVILPDIRNHGASPHAFEHSYNSMVADIVELLDDLEMEKIHILGHSMGGKVAMAFANSYPEKILSLIVADIVPKNYLNIAEADFQYNFHRKILTALSQIDLSNLKSRKEVDGQLKHYIEELHVRLFILKNLYRNGETFEWKINVPVLKSSLEHIVSGVDWSNKQLNQFVTTYPVLFVKGELSNYIQSDDAELIKYIYPEAKIEVVEGATHFLHAEKTREFIAIIENFLSV